MLVCMPSCVMAKINNCNNFYEKVIQFIYISLGPIIKS